MKPIILRTRTSTDECIGTVRLTPEAEKVVRRLRFKTGLPIRQIVSEIIVQAENLIDISGDDDEDETDQRGGPGMYEYKYSIGVRHESTGEKLKLEVWAEDVDAATHKLTGTLIGPECEYIWTGSGPIYENNQLIRREKKD